MLAAVDAFVDRAIARADRLGELAADPRPRAFSAPWGVAMVHRDGYPGRRGGWRVTFLRPDGEQAAPHAPADGYFAALELTQSAGADLGAEVLIS
jgi:hypothetical protein